MGLVLFLKYLRGDYLPRYVQCPWRDKGSLSMAAKFAVWPKRKIGIDAQGA